MKRIILVFLLVMVFIVVLVFWFYSNIQPASGDKNFGSFVIAKGSSASQIGNKLKSSGFIKNALSFKIYVQFTGQAGKLQTGEFRLSPSMNLFETVKTLFKGPVELWVTIPEGLRREEIADRFAKTLSRDQSFVDEFLTVSKGAEGMLFPDTYLFPKDASASGIVSRMTKTFDMKTADLSSPAGLTFNQRIVLASIIERETKTPEERPIVAGILINRFNVGMPLQVDASVQYAVGAPSNWWPILSADDLKINSRYNSYKFAGLPPSPIASPGLSSITAAFTPVGSDYWYYIHDSDGLIHYAKTLSEHNDNVGKYLTR